PLVLFGIMLALPLSSFESYENGRADVAGYANNIAVAAAMASRLIGLAGRLWGVVSWVFLMASVLLGQALAPEAAPLLPLSMHLTADLIPDTEPRWLWLVVLGFLASMIAVVRRSVPLIR